jgi:teichuronic acid biosynthesis glycosyltransferase TuaC
MIPFAHRLRRGILRVQSLLLTATLTKSREMEGALPASVAARNAVVPNGVDRGHFTPLDRDEARDRLGWNSSERVVLFAADPAVERKRFWLAQAACNAAAEEVGEIRLHVATGVDPAEMPILMSAADCLLLTSSIEGSPNVVKEALMCDLPVVSTPVGDVDELLQGVEPSWIREAEPEALAGALVDCLVDPRRSNGRHASAWLGSDAIAERVLALYAELAPTAVEPKRGAVASAA